MKKLGFGCMRLPMMGGADGEVDKREFCRMVDTFLAEGFCYFDTAHGYLNGKSETALRECLTARYPRESYILTDKLTSFFFEKEDDILPLFEQQLEKTGVSYFDYYLLHALNGAYYEKFTRCNAFEIVKQLKEQGRVKHIGISFHDKPALLERVLDEHPEIEVVQIQFNYADYENPSIESRAVYEVCRRHQKPVIVMEPVKGGGLIQLPEEAKAVLDGVGTGSYASYAVRYAASFEGVFMVLSGMSNYEPACRQRKLHERFSALYQRGIQGCGTRAGDFETAGQHSLYGLPLLCAGLPEAYSHPRPGSAVTTPKNSLETGTATSITET